MIQVVPDGFVTFIDTRRLLADRMFSGQPSPAAVHKCLELFGGAPGDVDDGEAAILASDAIWAAVDAGHLPPFLIAPKTDIPYQISDLPPLVRARQGLNLRFVRRQPFLARELQQRFGLDLTGLQLVFKLAEVDKLLRKTSRRRRRRVGNDKQRLGRPSHQPQVKAAVTTIVRNGHWSTTKRLGALTRLVDKAVPFEVNDKIVGRALETLFRETGERQFMRIIHRRKGKQPAAKAA